MSDKRISQLPIGELTPDSIFLTISNGPSSYITYNDILSEILISDKFITGGSFNQIAGITTFYLNDNTSFNVSGYFTGFTNTPEFVFNKQNSMNYDGSGVKYPTVNAVNELTNNLALATINTGFIDSSDSFVMTKLDDNTLAFSASNKGIIFKSLLETPPFIASNAIIQIPNTLFNLNNIGLTSDGVYIKFIGYEDTGNIVYSDTSLKGSHNTAQLGIVILKVSGGTTSFLDSTRNVVNIPSICSYSNLEITMLDLQSDVIVRPNTGMTINNTSGSIMGMSVNWHGSNNDEKPIASNSISLFTHLSQGNALTTIPPIFISAVTTSQYWDGISLVNLSTSGAASIQRWIVTINGSLSLQYGEQEYIDLDTAIENLSTASFIDILPKDTYVEIGRMAAIRNTTNLSDINQAVFRVKLGVGSGGDTTETIWGTITGNINDQRDLFDIFETSSNSPFVDLGNSQSPITNINLLLGNNLKVTLTGNTFFNLIPTTEGNESNLILKLPVGVTNNIEFSPNVIWDNNIIPTFNNTEGGRDTSFSVTLPSSQVNTISPQLDGKIVVGGSFTTFNSVSSARISRANINGSRDSSFNVGTGFNSTVQVITTQSDGKLLVGGQFNTYNNISSNRLVRINTDGSPDSTFNIGTGFNSTVCSIAVQPDNKVLVGGDFNTYSGVSQLRLTRLNSDGNIDITFNIGTGFNGTVSAVTQQSDGKILCGGNFTTYSGITSPRLIRLNSDGNVDNTFNMFSGFNNTVNSIVVQPDNKIVVGGLFTSYNPIFSNFLIKIDFLGNKDESFVIGGGFNSSVAASVQQSDGKILFGGNFTTYNGITSPRLIRLNIDGSVDNTFNIGTGFNSTVNSIVVQPDNKIIVGGVFTTYSGLVANRIIRLNSDGTKDFDFSGATAFGFDGIVRDIVLQSGDNKLICGGDFTKYNNVTQNRIVRLNPDGTKDISFTGSLNNNVYSLKQQLDGKTLAAGAFTNTIVRYNLDGTIDSTFNITISSAFVVSQQSDGKILVGGNFTTFGGFSAGGIVRLNLDGSRDFSFNSTIGFNASSTITTLLVQSDGKILVGGSFTSFNNSPQQFLIRLNSDGSRDITFFNGTGCNSSGTLFLESSGETKLFVSGAFTSIGGLPTYSIARLNSDGSLDSNFNIGGSGFNLGVNSLVLQSNGKILCGGVFTNYNGITTSRVARLNLDGTYDSSLIIGTGANNVVFTTALQFDGKILFGGLFTTFNSVAATRLVRLNVSPEINYYFKLLQDGSNIIIK